MPDLQPQQDIIDFVRRNDLCAGCGLCESLASPQLVKVELNALLGLYRPNKTALLKPDVSALIERTCPGLNVAHEQVDGHFDPVWGPIRSVSLNAAADVEIRHQGSSGGVLSALQIHLLESSQVDYILSTRVSPTDPFGTEISVCRTRDDVLASAGSRYAPSAPLRDILDRLESPERFAFVGKPCDVAALRNLAKIDARVNEKIPYMLSFMCAGVPARQGTLDIVKHVGLQPDEVVSFRYRGDGWPGFAKATDDQGNSGSMSYEESWQRKLSPHIQWRCKFCPDGTGEHADIACADAWHLNEDGTPDFSEHRGRSFSIVRTPTGAGLLQAAMDAGSLLDLGAASEADLENTQFHQAYRKKTSSARFIALSAIGLHPPRYSRLALLRASLKTSPISLIRALGGTLSRARKKFRSAAQRG